MPEKEDKPKDDPPKKEKKKPGRKKKPVKPITITMGQPVTLVFD
jgi:hypothetical protein